MKALSDWIISNKEWLFSGVGIAIVIWLVRFIFKRIHGSSTQTIRAGDRSTNVQAGGDIIVGMKKKETDVEDI